MRRRRLCHAGLFGLLATAGCIGDDPDDDSPNESEASTETPTETETPSDSEPESSADRRVDVSIDGDTVEAVTAADGDRVARGENARRVINEALREVPGGGIVALDAGTYVASGGPVVVPPWRTLVGAGPGETTVRLPPELHRDAHTVVMANGGDDGGTVVRDLAVDGNEATNRDIDPYPDVPPANGLIVQGSDVTVENVHAHDTIRSNVVVVGTDCDLRSLRLANAATDHWVYLADAERCTVRDVHASGFIRGGGFVFGTTGQVSRENTLRNVTVEGVSAPPHPDTLPRRELAQEYPLLVCVLRPDGDGRGNTVRNVHIKQPDGPFNYRIVVAQPDATVSNVRMEGPVGDTRNLLQVGAPRDSSNVSGTTVSDVTFAVTDAGDFSDPAVVEVIDSGATVTGVETVDHVARHAGVRVSGQFRPVRDTVVRECRVDAERAALVADGESNQVTELTVASIVDAHGSGVETRGDVSFASRSVEEE